MTEIEKEMFRSLRESGLSKTLIEYLQKLMDDLCDIRKMKTHNEAEFNARTHLHSIIENKVIRHLRSTGVTNKQNPNKYL